MRLAQELRPDLAILDVKMPGIDGLEAARQINAGRFSAVLILTAFSQRQFVDEARDAGALAYLVKPYQKADLIPAMELAIARFSEMQSMAVSIESLEAQLAARKAIDRAKGKLMDEFGMKEADAFQFVQRTAMTNRLRMLDVAEQVIAGSLRP